MKHLNLFTVGAMTLLVLSLPFNHASAMGTAESVASSPGVGQSPNGASGKSVTKKLEKLTTVLTLTSDEQAKIKPILEQEAVQVKALHGDKTLGKADHLAKLKLIHADTKTKIAAVLNSDQQKKFADMGPGHRSISANKS